MFGCHVRFWGGCKFDECLFFQNDFIKLVVVVVVVAVVDVLAFVVLGDRYVIPIFLVSLLHPNCFKIFSHHYLGDNLLHSTVIFLVFCFLRRNRFPRAVINCYGSWVEPCAWDGSLGDGKQREVDPSIPCNKISAQN